VRRGRLAALIELGAGFHPDLTGRENIYLNSALLGLTHAQTERHFGAIVDFSGIEKFIDTQVKFYSSGMYVRLAFAVAVHVDPDVLLVDEVLAVGDEPFQRKCMDRIHSFQNEGRTIILVTHALDQVAELCDRAVVLEEGKVQIDGKPRDALRHLRADFEATREEERERERRGELNQPATRAAVVGVKITDDDGATLRAIKPGDSVTVCIEVNAQEPLDRWVLGFSIETPLGQMVYGTNTKLLGLPLPTVRGLRQFKLRLPSLWLGEGQYTIQAAIAEGTGVEIHRISAAAALVVEASGQSIGYLHARPELIAD
jgi:ABC-2 type transport system ATP-binding protein